MRDDGRIVALAGGFQALWPLTAGVVTYPWVIRDLDANTFTPVAAPPKASPSTNPATAPASRIAGFSPDGQRVYLSDIVWSFSASSGIRAGWTVEYDIVGNRERQAHCQASASPRAIADSPTAGRCPWSRSGELLAHVRHASGLSRYDVVTGRVTKLVPRRIGAFPATANRRTLYRRSPCPSRCSTSAMACPCRCPRRCRPASSTPPARPCSSASADATILPGGTDTNGVDDVFAVDLLSRLRS